MVKRISFLFLLFIAVTASAPKSYASVNCQPIYGGGQTCVANGEIQIDKKIRHPKTGDFVDNLSINEVRYHSGETIIFKINVTNTGDADFSSVEVKDILPQYVTFVSGPGKFDEKTNTLKYSLNNLKANETRTNDITLKVIDQSSLPINQGVFCVVNQSSLNADGKTALDNSQFCIEKVTPTTKGGLPVMPPPGIAQTPPTGPEMLGLIGLIPAGLAGILLRRKTKNK